MSKTEPKINRKKALRLAIGLFLIAGLVFAILWLLRLGTDPDLGSFESVGYIAAVEMVDPDGARVVVFNEGGQIQRSPGWEVIEDRAPYDDPPVWRPDGNRVFFVSDRDGLDRHIYRWNPDNDALDRVTVDKRSKSAISFNVPGTGEDNNLALFQTAGTIIEYDFKEKGGVTILPPSGLQPVQSSEEGGGAVSAMEIYSKFGNSFREGRWLKSKQWIATVMRADTGEVLLIQNMATPGAPPIPLAKGDRIDMDVNPVTGVLVYCVQNFAFADEPPAEYVDEKGRVKIPFEHAIALVDPYRAGEPPLHQFIAQTPDNGSAFRNVKVSPDGEKLLVVVGDYKGGGTVTGKGMLVMPFEAGGIQKQVPLIQGDVLDPSWSPDSRQIVYVQRTAGKSSIFTISLQNGFVRNVSGDQGNFRYPVFSPQTIGE